MVRGLSKIGAERLIQIRSEKTFNTDEELLIAASLNSQDMESLAKAEALSSKTLNRRAALWLVTGIKKQPPLFSGVSTKSTPVKILPENKLDGIIEDYSSLGFSTRGHPLKELRTQLNNLKIKQSSSIRFVKNGRNLHVAGIVTSRQKPATANGIIFITLED